MEIIALWHWDQGIGVTWSIHWRAEQMCRDVSSQITISALAIVLTVDPPLSIEVHPTVWE